MNRFAFQVHFHYAIAFSKMISDSLELLYWFNLACAILLKVPKVDFVMTS